MTHLKHSLGSRDRDSKGGHIYLIKLLKSYILFTFIIFTCLNYCFHYEYHYGYI